MVRFSVEDVGEEEEAIGMKRKKRSEGTKEATKKGKKTSEGTKETSEKGKKLPGKGDVEVEEELVEEEVVEGEGQAERGGEVEASGRSSAIDNNAGITATVDPDVLDCSICFEPLRAPIYQCKNGHVTCPSCCNKLINCHICTQPIRYRCLALEKVIDSITVSCSNAEYGCKRRTSYARRPFHEKTCIHAPCFCPMPNCTFSGSMILLSAHFYICHVASMMHIVEDELFEVRLERDKPFLVLHGPGDDLFLLNNSREANGNAISMACIRPNSLAYMFKYEFTVRGNGGSLHLNAGMPNIKKHDGAHPNNLFLVVPHDLFSSSGKIYLDVCISTY